MPLNLNIIVFIQFFLKTMMCTLPILSLRMHCLIRNIKIIIIIFGNRHIHHTIPLPIAIGNLVLNITIKDWLNQHEDYKMTQWNNNLWFCMWSHGELIKNNLSTLSSPNYRNFVEGSKRFIRSGMSSLNSFMALKPLWIQICAW